MTSSNHQGENQREELLEMIVRCCRLCAVQAAAAARRAMADGCGAWHWPAKEVRERRACMCSSAVTLWHCMEACHALGRVRRGAEAVERTEERPSARLHTGGRS